MNWKNKKKNNLGAFIVSFETMQRLLDDRLSGDDSNIRTIRGDEAAKLIENAGIELGGILNAETYYCFCWNRNKTRLIPIRMSMKPKTAYNIMKGSRRYGSLRILHELF